MTSYPVTLSYFEALSEDAPDIIIDTLKTDSDSFNYAVDYKMYEAGFALLIDRANDELYDYYDGSFEADALRIFYMLYKISDFKSPICEQALSSVGSISTLRDIVANRDEYIRIATKTSLYSFFNSAERFDISPDECLEFIEPIMKSLDNPNKAKLTDKQLNEYLLKLSTSEKLDGRVGLLTNIITWKLYDAFESVELKRNVFSLLDKAYGEKSKAIYDTAVALGLQNDISYWTSHSIDVTSDLDAGINY